MVGVQVRTIFLAVRGVNMLGNSLSKPRSDMTELEKAEANLQQRSYKMLFAGAAFLTFGVFMARALSGLLAQSSKGAVMLDDLGLAWGRFSSRLSASVAHNLEGQVKGLIQLMDSLSGNQGAVENLGFIATYATEATIALGALALSAAGLRTLSGILSGILNFSPSISFGLALKGATLYNAVAAWLGGSVVGGIVSFALPIVLSLLVTKWLVDVMPESEKKKMIDTIMGKDWRTGGTNTTPGSNIVNNMPTGGNQFTNPGAAWGIQIPINIFGNTWDKNVDEKTLGEKVGQQVADSFLGTVNR